MAETGGGKWPQEVSDTEVNVVDGWRVKVIGDQQEEQLISNCELFVIWGCAEAVV